MAKTVEESQDLNEFGRAAEAWFVQHTPAPPDFMLPLTFMEVGTDQQFEFLQDWQCKVYEAGFLGAAWPSAYGGGGLTDAHQHLATQIMRKHRAPIMLNAIGLNWVGPLLLEMGSEAHKKAYIRGILNAQDIWCQGFSEPDHGSDLGNVQLRAVRQGDSYVLNGSKIWTTHGHYARYMILLARTEPDTQSKYAGLSFILSPMQVAGIETVKIRKLTGEHGFTQTFFTDARVPASGLMGEEGQGWQIAMRALEYERNARGGQAGGYVISEVNPLEVLDLAKRMSVQGEGGVSDPLVCDRLLDFIMDVQAFNLNRQRAEIAPLMQDRPHGLSLISKLAQTEYMREINQFALTMLGVKGSYYVDEPNGVDNGYWHRNYLNAFSATIGGGTSQIQRNIIAEHVLGLPKT